MPRRKLHLYLLQKVEDVNLQLHKMSSKLRCGFIDNREIDSDEHLVSDGLHLNQAGVTIFATTTMCSINQPSPHSPLDQPISSAPPQPHPHMTSMNLNKPPDHHEFYSRTCPFDLFQYVK